MRIVIVGGGVIGLLTAIDCLSAGHHVVLLDQGSIPFRGAASFDRHRVVRALHPDDPAAIRAAIRAHHRWLGLQRLLSARFYAQVGALTVLPPGRAPAAQAMLAAAGSRARVLDPGELASGYPKLTFPSGAWAVLESQAGVLLADRVLQAAVDWLRGHPRAELRPHRRAVGVEAGRAAVRLADGEVVPADAVLLAAGPWSRDLLPPHLAAQLVLHRQSVLYCQAPAPDAAAWAVTPAMLSLGTGGGAWLVPPTAGTPLKLSVASACRQVARIEDNATPPRWRDHLIEAFTEVIPGFRAGWVTGARDCYYLARATAPPVMCTALADRVVSYAACGGSSFKFAPLIARSLAGRLTGVGPRERAPVMGGQS